MKTGSPRLFLKVVVGSVTLTAIFMAALVRYVTYEPPVGGDFSLTFRGEPWIFSEVPKHLNVLYIGYAKCPDVCPMTLRHAGQAFRSLTESEAKSVQLLFLSVDRDNDKPNDVANYAAQFFPGFIGLSGSREEIDKVVSMYHASYMIEKNPKSYLGYSIAHTDRLFFLDGKGVVVGMISSPRSSEEILKAIKENL